MYANRQNFDEGFYDLSGGSRVDQYVAIVPSVRVEHQDQVGVALFTETRVTNSATAFGTEDILNRRMRKFTDVTEALELRYTGITNWSLYARAELLEGQGTLKENEFDVEDDGSLSPVQLQRETDSERFVQKYVAGANWYPCRKSNFGAQYQAGLKDDKMFASIKEGLKDGAKEKMKPFKDKLTEDEIKALIAHVRTLKK